MKILFLDGLGTNPESLKAAFLRQRGFEVSYPTLPDRDFEASVRIARDAAREQVPQVIVGYSRGGAVALALDLPDIPLALLAPAWRACGVSSQVRQRAVVILHSPGDDLVPLEDSRELLRNSGLPESALVVVGDDHSMIDEAAVNALIVAVRRFQPE